MFDLLKDLDRYQGVPPYASEHYGIYQPILGWRSRLTSDWVRLSSRPVDPRLRRILDGRITPGPTTVEDFIARPLIPGTGRSPWQVALAKDIGSELMHVIRDAVQGFVDQHEGRLPEGAQWSEVIEINQMMDADRGPLRVANQRHRTRLMDELHARFGANAPGAAFEAAQAELLTAMQFESQVAAMLLFHAEAQGGYEPEQLAKLFTVTAAPTLDTLFASADPLASIDPHDPSGVLSPIGFVHLFRQYFFDLGTFLGEPVEHVWLAPGTTIELIEVSTRRTLVERTEEVTSESTQRSEQSSAVKDELSDAIKSENDSSTKIGVTMTNSVQFGVYQGTATASVGVENARKDARESVHKQSREQSEKLSSEIKQSYKSVFRTVTETTDTRTKRYLLQNTGPDLVNYELRRKMRRVGVQLQDLGTQLCWQVFVDDPGAALGLAELVHYAESPDIANIKHPDPLPYPGPLPVKMTLPIPFHGENTDDNAGALYEWRGEHPDGNHYGNRMNTGDEDEQDKRVILGPFNFHAQAPQPGYELTEVRPIGPQGSQIGIARSWTVTDPTAGAFDVVMHQVQYNGQKQIPFEVELVFTPTASAIASYEATRKKAEQAYDAEVLRLVQKTYADAVRDRIDAAHAITTRPSWDLREEERTVVYRTLLQRLTLGNAWASATDDGRRRLNHVRSEIVRAIFDVDAMLYFVAPEWWMPRRHQTAHTYNPNVTASGQTVHLGEEERVRWKDVPARPDNYSITENSEPARLGSSLGWLLQLDGDNLRNAFLNAPWVKAVVPVRPGRERAALNWLRAVEGQDGDGWESQFVPGTPEDDALVAEVTADGLAPTLGNVLERIAAKLEVTNAGIGQTLAADKVFEHGFNPLAGGFDAGLPATEVFSQWVSVLPTDQLVAVEYKATNQLGDL